jgi:hypothetical protein
MNRRNMMTSVAVSLLIAFFSSQANAQRPGTTDARGARGALGFIPTVNVRAGMIREHRATDDRLTCGPASGNRGYWAEGGNNTIINLSFGQPYSGGPIGSWTIRHIYPAKGGRPETIVGYFFDGTFTSGTVNYTGQSPRIFDLRGRTNYTSSYCNARNAPTDNTVRDIRIWGSCEDPAAAVNFEVTSPAGVYASGTFRHNVSAVCGPNAPSTVNLTLNRH